MAATVGENLFIGAQVAYWRKRRGKSQRVLAGLAGMSQPYLSQIENGLRPVDRRATLIALANALQVSVADLTGKPGDPTDPAKALAASHVPDIREALIRREVGEIGVPVGDVEEAMKAGGDYNFTRLAPMLPGLLIGLRGPDLVQIAHITSYTLRDLGYPDLARDAGRLAITEAYDHGAPEWVGIAEFIRILTMPPEMPGAPMRLAQRVADQIQPHTGDPAVRQAYGMLHLTAGLRAAVGGDRDAAMDHLGEAREAADSMGEPVNLGLARFAFGPTNVGFWSVAMHLELSEPEKALEAARNVHPELVPLANRQGPFYSDLGTALAQVGHDHEAIAAFLRSEAAGPQWFRLRPTVKDTVGSIIRRTKRNSVTKPMRAAAAAVNLQQLVSD
jgi:transcriptional regulator with XRE-family HTH domain